MGERQEDYRHRGRDDVLIWIDELDPPYCRITWSTYPHQNDTRTRRKVERLCRLYGAGRHTCQRCGELIAPYKRLDARYCTEACRKAQGRERRALKS